MVALTGIECVFRQFSSVQLGLSSCVFSPVHIRRSTKNPFWRSDVVTRESLDAAAHPPRWWANLKSRSQVSRMPSMRCQFPQPTRSWAGQLSKRDFRLVFPTPRAAGKPRRQITNHALSGNSVVGEIDRPAKPDNQTISSKRESISRQSGSVPRPSLPGQTDAVPSISWERFSSVTAEYLG